MNQPTVLIVADDAEFPRALMARWGAERVAAPLTIVGSNLLAEADGPAADVSVVGGVELARMLELVPVLMARVPVVLCLAETGEDAETLHHKFPKLCVLRRAEGWEEAVVALVSETLRRMDATERARSAEELAEELARHAALGRYMLEMRHGFSNALTSVLGNSELLLMDPQRLGEEVCGQLETIHAMALRMHEILQRFSSLDKEMQFAGKKSQTEMAWPKAASGL